MSIKYKDMEFDTVEEVIEYQKKMEGAKQKVFVPAPKREMVYGPGEPSFDNLDKIEKLSILPPFKDEQKPRHPFIKLEPEEELIKPEKPSYFVKKDSWTATDDKTVLKYINSGEKLNLEKLSKEFNRTQGALLCRINQIRRGAIKVRTRKTWTEAEHSIVREGYENGIKPKKIAESLPGRTASAISLQAFLAGLTKRCSIKTTINTWTTKEIEILKEGYKNQVPLKDLAEKLPKRTVATIAVQAHTLGISKKRGTMIKKRPTMPLTYDESCIKEANKKKPEVIVSNYIDLS